VGTIVPLDPSTPVFLVRSLNLESGRVPVERAEADTAMAPHWVTCKKIKDPSAEPDRPATDEDLARLRERFGGSGKT